MSWLRVMDECIGEYLLQIAGGEFDKCKELNSICTEKTPDTIRHEKVEPGSPMIFHVYVFSVKEVYKVGLAIKQKRLAYKIEMQ